MRLGRAEDNEIVLSDVGVSRRHAQVYISRGEVTIEDLGSGNGTYYNGYRIQSQPLQDGDEVVIDPFVLQFRVHGNSSARGADADSRAPARLEVVVGTGMAGSSYPITSRGLTIGRSEDRDVVIPDPASSRNHCQIAVQGGQYVLRDQGSANGVFVNAVRVRDCTLTDGDLIRIGNTEMRFVRYDEGTSDTTTQVVPDQVWNQGGAGSWSAEVAAQPPPPQVSYPPPATGGGAGRSLIAVFVGGLIAFTVMTVVLVIVFVAVLLVVNGQFVLPEPIPAHKPRWALELPGGLDRAATDKLFDEGVSKMRGGDKRGALQDFYRVLQADPGNASAEKFAFAAGELMVLDSLQGHFEQKAAAKAEHEKRRDKLIRDSESRYNRVSKRAKASLEEEFRGDPVAQEHMGWKPTPEQKKDQQRGAAAADLMNREEYGKAAELYLLVLESSHDETLRKNANAGLKVSHREIARAVTEPWAAAVVQEARGEGEPGAAFDEILEEYPTHASARLHKERLEAE